MVGKANLYFYSSYFCSPNRALASFSITTALPMMFPLHTGQVRMAGFSLHVPHSRWPSTHWWILTGGFISSKHTGHSNCSLQSSSLSPGLAPSSTGFFFMTGLLCVLIFMLCLLGTFGVLLLSVGAALPSFISSSLSLSSDGKTAYRCGCSSLNVLSSY